MYREPKNEDRARWANNAVDVFALETYAGRTFTAQFAQDLKGDTSPGCDSYTMIQDLISDLMHLTHQCGWDAGIMLERAAGNFEEELVEEEAGE